MRGAICAPSMRPRPVCSRHGRYSWAVVPIGMARVGIGTRIGICMGSFLAMASGTVLLAGRSIRHGLTGMDLDSALAGMAVASSLRAGMDMSPVAHSLQADILLVRAGVWGAD